MNSTKTISFGIVGCGIIARFHALAIADVPGARLIGACSKSFSSTEKFCAECNIRAFADYEQMLAEPELDAVVICTPSGDHAGQIMAALKAGKHVVAEKPMCLTMEDADAVVAMAEQSGKMVCVISQTRFSDGVQAIKQAIDAGAMGKLVSASLMMRYFRSPEYYNLAGWRGTIAGDGGGVLMNQGIHGIDVMCYLMGNPVGVTGYSRTLLRDIEVEDTAAAAVEFDTGALAVIDATVCSQPAMPRRLTICGEKGSVVLEEDSIAAWNLPIPCPVEANVSTGSSGAADPKGITHENFTREYRNIMAHLVDGAPLLLDARQGRMPLSVILGVYESSKTGKAVQL